MSETNELYFSNAHNIRLKVVKRVSKRETDSSTTEKVKKKKKVYTSCGRRVSIGTYTNRK